MGRGCLKIATWNCNGALRNKLAEVSEIDADILVIQECEDPARSGSRSYKEWATNYLWLGDNKSRGIGIFANSTVGIRPACLDPAGLELFLPCWVNESTLLVAVWTKRGDSKSSPYIGQLWSYIQAHRLALAANQAVVIGDLNSNVCWDKPRRHWNHSDVVQELAGLGLRSAYHHCRNQPQGGELEPTFFLKRRLAMAYHIDYIFVPEQWLDDAKLEVGEADHWLGVSDHMPVVMRIALPE